MSIALTPIGTIHTPFSTLDNMPIQPSGARDIRGTITLEARFAAGLRDLDGFSHIILIYHFHRSSGFELIVEPFLDTVPHGLFATRAPRRPNPIGLSVVRLLGIAGPVLTVADIDVLDGTPLLDIKPWVPEFDGRGNVRVGWLEKTQKESRSFRSDGRFVEEKP